MRSHSFVILLFISLIKFITSSPAADWDDAFIENRKPVFRKDYTLAEQNIGWFKLHHIPEEFDDARIRCELEGAELVSPVTTQLYNAMLSKMGDIHSVLTGIHSLFSYGDYYSLKGEPLHNMPVNWTIDLAPNKADRCVELLKNGTINVVNCHKLLPYLCFKDNNYKPLTECGTIDTAYSLNKELGICYKVHTEKKDWSNAFKTCAAEGGHLAIINGEAELSAVAQLITNATSAERNITTIFLGIVDWMLSGHWVTIHGNTLEESGFSRWKPSHPIRSFHMGLCGALEDQANLVAALCDIPMSFVCEKRPDSLITSLQLFEITYTEIDI